MNLNEAFTIKYALMMDVPDGKLPGYYAQVVKALSTKATLFDRDKELLITSTEEQSQAVEEVLLHYKIPYEPMKLYLLSKQAKIHVFLDDIGFTSRLDHTYLYDDAVIPFQFVGQGSPEQAQAHMQMCENIMVTIDSIYFTSRSLTELIEGIAKAYHCDVRFLDE